VGEKAVDRRYPSGHVIASKWVSAGDRACLTTADAEAERSEIASRVLGCKRVLPYPCYGVSGVDIGTWLGENPDSASRQSEGSASSPLIFSPNKRLGVTLKFRRNLQLIPLLVKHPSYYEIEKMDRL